MALNQNPNAVQKQWREDISNWLRRKDPEPKQFHHVVGRTYIHNKIPIGHWFILPLPIYLHDVTSNDPRNVTHFPKAFTEAYGMQRDIFKDMVDDMRAKKFDVPPAEVLDAIADTRY